MVNGGMTHSRVYEPGTYTSLCSARETTMRGEPLAHSSPACGGCIDHPLRSTRTRLDPPQDPAAVSPLKQVHLLVRGICGEQLRGADAGKTLDCHPANMTFLPDSNARLRCAGLSSAWAMGCPAGRRADVQGLHIRQP